jgi:hypothetical protein
MPYVETEFGLLVPPRISCVPQTTVFDGLGDDAIELAALAGLDLLPWEQYQLKTALGTREDGKWSAFEVGLIVSRQNGKGSILEARELAGLFLLGEQLIIHSAHEFATSLEAFNRIRQLIENTPDLDAQVARMSHSHGAEGIELKNGQRLLFKTRTKGGGRGFSGDCVIMDEAMYLGTLQIGALRPTMMARPNPQLWVTGSAGNKESTYLGRIRSRALKKSDARLLFSEYSIEGCTDFCDPDKRDYRCPEHPSISDPASWLEANPSMNAYITKYQKDDLGNVYPAEFQILTEENIAGELDAMDIATFKMERLGIGDYPTETANWNVISEEAWFRRTTESMAPNSNLVFAVDVPPERSSACIMAIGGDGEGQVVGEITSQLIGDGSRELDYRPGTNWVVPRLIELCKRNRPRGVILDLASHAAEFKLPLENAGIKVASPTTREYAQACGRAYSALVPGRNNEPWLWHLDQEDLNNAVRGAEKRDLAGLWAWTRQNQSIDISPLVCLTLGLWGHEKLRLEKKASLDMAWG